MNETANKEVTSSLLRYICPDNWSDQKKEANPIDAEEIIEAIKEGKEVKIINAVIEGPFKFKSVNIENEVFIQRTKIRGSLDCSYATFKRVLNFENSIFETDATFKAVTAEKDIFFDKVAFLGITSFSDITVMGTFYSRSTTYKKQGIFSEGNFKKRIELNNSKFEGEANFVNAQIGSDATFTGAEFKERANFDSANIEGSAFFNPATFEGEADFTRARIGSVAGFTEAEFKKGANFDSVNIEGSAFFNPATFEGKANFVNAQIGSVAMFIGAKFKELASFNSAKIQGESHFEETTFANYVSFENTSFETIYFGEPEVGEPEAQFYAKIYAKIDLRGCVYNRIIPSSFWEQLMENIDPYDRQPFTQLEETFRRAGMNKLADDVYYMQKSRESAQKTWRTTPGAWLLDRFLWFVTGYGVRLHRLSALIVLILLFGTIIFHFEGAVEPNPDTHLIVHFSYWEAFWVSLNTFLPIEIPSGANWIPSSQIIRVLGIRFTTFATLLKLAGWILVPVGVAGISGILKR